MHGDVPAPVGTLERGDRGLALEEALGQEIDHAPGGLFVADREGGAVGGGGEGGGHRGSGEVAQSLVFTACRLQVQGSSTASYTETYRDYHNLVPMICPINSAVFPRDYQQVIHSLSTSLSTASYGEVPGLNPDFTSFLDRKRIEVRKDRVDVLFGKVDLRHGPVQGNHAFLEFRLQLAQREPGVDIAASASPL